MQCRTAAHVKCLKQLSPTKGRKNLFLDVTQAQIRHSCTVLSCLYSAPKLALLILKWSYNNQKDCNYHHVLTKRTVGVLQ